MDWAEVTQEELAELRRAMGPDVWDILWPFMPQGFIRAYSTYVEVLYGGDVTGAEEALVTDGGDKAATKWPLRDTRVLPYKAGADAWLTKAAKAIRQAEGRKGTPGP